MKFRTSKAVTIIELIMAIVIVGVMAGVSSMYIKETIGLWNFLSFRNESVAQARGALIRMSKEIRQADSITTAASSQLNFIALDLDGDTNDDTVEFYLNGANELRRVFNNNNSGQGDILASGITMLAFTYYDANKTVTADTALIRIIKITLTASSGTQSKTLKTLVWPRNL